MRLLFPKISLFLALGIAEVDAFTFSNSNNCRVASNNAFSAIQESPPLALASRSNTALYAKKKKGKNTPKDAALAALEALEAAADAPPADPAASNGQATATLDFLDDDAPLTKKEQMALEKKKQKEAKKAKKEQERQAASEMDEMEKNKRKKALKALAEMEAAEKAAGTVNTADDAFGDDAAAPLSKKEQKMAAKKAAKEEEKQAKKMKKKQAKNLGITVDEYEAREASGELDLGADEKVNGVNGDAAVAEAPINGDAAVAAPPADAPEKKKKLTAEERIRKERPPPRIRVMESSQPDYTALRLENIAITFRDQPVLKSATWGVQTGDRIGLVGANGAGKTTQLRILAGELEPTAGDVVKSSTDLRVAMLRQEFIDEIDLTRTLREEFMSAFVEEAAIMDELAEAEKQLEGMTGNEEDGNDMQEVLDRMAKLQAKADAKDVRALDSRVSKIMDLMGFESEEGDYEVNMFSGGWKMRIGLGKVLLKGE